VEQNRSKRFETAMRAPSQVLESMFSCKHANRLPARAEIAVRAFGSRTSGIFQKHPRMAILPFSTFRLKHH